jgi:sugar phosphate isomerase/epimerase
MYYTGFADEAGADIDIQIKATKELGWTNIEARNTNGGNIHDVSDAEFDVIAGKLEDAGIRVNCFGSTVANWGKDPRKEADFQRSKDELTRAIPRMKRLGSDMIRGMSFQAEVVKKTAPQDLPDLETTIFRKVNELVRLCEDAGVYYVHENCMNYGGMSYEHTLKLLENVRSDYFTLVFDTGNPVFADHCIGEPPYRKQSAWDFYDHVKQYIRYIHIKDGTFNKDNADNPTTFTWAGDGDGDVKRIVADLLANGYDGGFSMEPHMGAVFHDPTRDNTDDQAKYDTYVEYGRRFMKLVNDVKS